MNKIVKLAVSFLLSIFAVTAIAGSPVGQIYTGDTINGESLKLPSSKVSAAVIAAGPASGISYYQVYAVGSSNIGWEYPPASQTTTTYDHGGAQLRVVTFQYGYGSWNGATLNAAAGTHYARVNLCGPFSAPYYCAVGDTITGYLDYYSFDGLQGGYYTSSAYSTTSPYGTWTDSIYIQ